MYKILLITLLTLSTVQTAGAMVDKKGVGIIIGEPTGISGKLWTSDLTAVDGALSWSFREKGYVHIHTDYLYHRFDLFEVTEGRMPFYYGIGGRIIFKDKSEAGIRVPFGVSYIMEGDHFGFFVEIVPILDLIPSTDIDFSGGLGARYYF
ncbi:MAG: hypothetical protein ACQESB_07665 [Elusimicrobiota bacterium]